MILSGAATETIVATSGPFFMTAGLEHSKASDQARLAASLEQQLHFGD